ncbi:MAG: glucosiduronase, partial [Acidobacteriaceae bacterium]|nr:glucosiduronase [Acidobacteriaceae bacterium]
MKLFLALLFFSAFLKAESGYDAWLRYAPIDDPNVRETYSRLPATVAVLGSSLILRTAQHELGRGIRGMLGRTERSAAALPDESCILLGTLEDMRKANPQLLLPSLAEDAYSLQTTTAHGHRMILITASNDRGVLYGTFALLRKMALHENLDHLDEQQGPYAPIRWTNEWNNLNGTIERGYAGKSIFFENGNVVSDLSRASDYARLLASIGINGCTVNNVNADPRVITPEFLPQLAA